VVGGTLSGSYVAVLLGAPIGHWLRATTLPLLLVLGAGKLAMVLDGSGQGQPSELAWATAYVSAGPWGSLAPELPSHPAQAYEGIATLAILALLTLALAAGAFRARDGRLFFVGIGTWALARGAITLTWRDSAVAAGLNAGSLIATAVVLAFVVAVLVLALWRRGPPKPELPDGNVVWADPGTRPRF
jgi:prolipoprotein diacylglyceryltransferase